MTRWAEMQRKRSGGEAAKEDGNGSSHFCVPGQKLSSWEWGKEEW